MSTFNNRIRIVYHIAANVPVKDLECFSSLTLEYLDASVFIKSDIFLHTYYWFFFFLIKFEYKKLSYHHFNLEINFTNSIFREFFLDAISMDRHTY